MKTTLQYRIFSIVLKLLVLTFGAIGQIITLSSISFMSSSPYLYYTNMSNLWTIAIVALFLVFEVCELFGKTIIIPSWLFVLRFTLTVGIALTFFVFAVLLTPQLIQLGMEDYLTSPSNICVHTLVPVLAIVDFLLFGKNGKSRFTFLHGTIMPLAYVIFALTGSFTGLDFGGGAKVPYFFFDYDANGWFTLEPGRLGVVIWIIFIALFIILMSFIFCKIKNFIYKKSGIYNK